MYDIKTERKEKQMTLEQLRAAKQISNTNGRPAFHLTDEKRQKEFAIRKSFLQPYDKNIKNPNGKESGTWNEESRGSYYVHFNDLKTKYRDGYWEVWFENET